MIERNFVHIHKSEEISRSTKTFCKRLFEDVKQGVTYKNKQYATCPECISVADKVDRLHGK